VITTFKTVPQQTNLSDVLHSLSSWGLLHAAGGDSLLFREELQQQTDLLDLITNPNHELISFVCLSVCPVYRSLHLLLSAYLKITKNCRFPFRLCSSPISDCMRYIVSVIKRVLLRCCSCLHFNILGPYEIRMLRKGIGSRAPVCNVHVLRIDMLVASGTLQVLNIGVLI